METATLIHSPQTAVVLMKCLKRQSGGGHFKSHIPLTQLFGSSSIFSEIHSQMFKAIYSYHSY